MKLKVPPEKPIVHVRGHRTNKFMFT